MIWFICIIIIVNEHVYVYLYICECGDRPSIIGLIKMGIWHYMMCFSFDIYNQNFSSYGARIYSLLEKEEKKENIITKKYIYRILFDIYDKSVITEGLHHLFKLWLLSYMGRHHVSQVWP